MSNEQRFRGRTPGEAMHKARAELGDEARLVSARRVSAAGTPPVYEVRVSGPSVAAAPPADPAFGELQHEIRELKATVSSLIGSAAMAPPVVTPAAVTPPVVAPTAPAAPTPAEPAPADALTEELPSPVATPARPTDEVPAELDPWRDLLLRRGVGDRAAKAILLTAHRHLQHRLHDEPRDAVRAALSDRFGPTRRRDRLGDGSTIFVGPTGSGKTSTVAKVAADLVAAGERPILVCADGESLTGEENLQAVATALGLTFEVAFLDGQLETLVEGRGHNRTYLVDTPGIAPGDRDALDRLRPLVDALDGPEILLVMSGTSDLEEARMTARAFAGLGAEQIVLTKLDEMTRPGRLVDLAASLPRPVARVTYGRSARGNSAHPGAEPVIARILGSNLAVERTA